MAQCFKCENLIKAAATFEKDQDEMTWKVPQGVVFTGGGNFGSELYDSFVDGISVKIIICDNCLKQAQNTERLREIKK